MDFRQDDFALVLMEDAEGEQLSLTEEYPTNDHFKVDERRNGEWDDMGIYTNIWDNFMTLW